jgi:hypothetical protein|tara:strand:+ start:3725 stop:3892 length:168 start_codon:yes stop_codon:yes gene_type:complete
MDSSKLDLLTKKSCDRKGCCGGKTEGHTAVDLVLDNCEHRVKLTFSKVTEMTIFG